MVLWKANIATAMAICFIDLTKTWEKRNEALWLSHDGHKFFIILPTEEGSVPPPLWIWSGPVAARFLEHSGSDLLSILGPAFQRIGSSYVLLLGKFILVRFSLRAQLPGDKKPRPHGEATKGSLNCHPRAWMVESNWAPEACSLASVLWVWRSVSLGPELWETIKWL